MIASVWKDCVDNLKIELPEQQFNTWIRPLQLDETEADILRLVAPNRFVLDWVNDKFRTRIEDLAKQASPSAPLQVEVCTSIVKPGFVHAKSANPMQQSIAEPADARSDSQIGSSL